MNNIPKKLREELAESSFYQTCSRRNALHDHDCRPDPVTGKLIEWEHALISAGKQVQKKFAIIPICWFVHRGPGLNKEVNVWIALHRASEDELFELSKKGGVDYFMYKSYLTNKFGVYDPVFEGVINY